MQQNANSTLVVYCCPILQLFFFYTEPFPLAIKQSVPASCGIEIVISALPTIQPCYTAVVVPTVHHKDDCVLFPGISNSIEIQDDILASRK